MVKVNYKYLLILQILAVMLFGQDLQIEKESDGVYTAIFEKEFTIDGELAININDYSGDIIINGTSSNELEISEICSFKSYSEQDAKLKYYKSKVGFILNQNQLKIEGKRRTQKFDNVIELTVPDYTVIIIEGNESDITVTQLDGDMTILASDCNIEFNHVSSKVHVKGKSCDVNIIDCSLIGDVLLSRGMLTINNLKSEYLETILYGADLEGHRIDTKLTCKSTGGDVYIDELNNNGNFTSSGGDIYIEEVSGDIVCDSKGGDIELELVEGKCNIKCVSGEISISEVHDDLTIMANNSEIEVDEAYASIDVENSNKDVEIRKYTRGEDFSVIIKNRNNDIDFYLDSTTKANISTEVEFNRGDDDDYEIESDFELENYKKERHGKQGYISRQGNINGGGASIILKNQNGNIYIYED